MENTVFASNKTKTTMLPQFFKSPMSSFVPVTSSLSRTSGSGCRLDVPTAPTPWSPTWSNSKLCYCCRDAWIFVSYYVVFSNKSIKVEKQFPDTGLSKYGWEGCWLLMIERVHRDVYMHYPVGCKMLWILIIFENSIKYKRHIIIIDTYLYCSISATSSKTRSLLIFQWRLAGGLEPRE